MPGRSIRIARIAGIPVGVSPWWLVIVALITWSLGASYFPEVITASAPGASYALGLASALLLFASILAHEFGHAIVARRHGIEVEEIDLWLLGGVSRMRGEAHDPGDELRYALAGPAVTAVIAACFGAAALLLPSSTPAVMRALVEYQVFVNGADPRLQSAARVPARRGRVLRSLLWRRSGEIGRSTETAASVGRGFGYVMIALGGLEFLSGAPEGLWLALIGFFIVMAAGAQAVGAQVQAALSGVHAFELMSSAGREHPRANLRRAGGRRVVRAPPLHRVSRRGRAGPGDRAGERHADRGACARPPARRAAEQRVGEIADRDPGLIVAGDEDVARLLERPAFARFGRAVVVDERRQAGGPGLDHRCAAGVARRTAR